MAVASLAIAIVAKTLGFQKGFRKARKLVRAFTTDMRAMARTIKRVGVALTGIAVAASYALAKAAMAGENFHRSMNRSLAILTGVDRNLRKQMVETALQVASVTKNSATEAAQAYYYLASAGMNAAQSMKALPAVARFAQAGMFDMATATELAADAQAAMGLRSTDAEENLRQLTRVTDVLTKANTLAQASIEQFAKAITTKAGVQMRNLNVSLEDGVAALAAFAQQGVKAEEGGTALAIVLRDLADKAIVNASAFKKYHIRVFDEVTGQFRGLTNVIADMEDALAGASDEYQRFVLRELGFQVRSVGFTQALIGQSRNLYRWGEALKRAGGYTKLVADKQLTPLEKGLARLGAEWTRLTNSMEPFVTLAGHLLGKLADSMGDLAKVFTPEFVTFFVEDMLNRLDLFIRELKADAYEIASTFMDIVAGISKFVDTGLDPAKLKAKAKAFSTAAYIERNKVTSARNAMDAGLSVNTLWGTQVRNLIQRPMQELAKAINSEKLKAAGEYFATVADAFRFEGGRFVNNPLEMIKRFLFGIPIRKKVPAEAVAAPKMMEEIRREVFRATALSPYIRATSGVSLGSQGIDVKYMRELLQETKKQTDILDDLDTGAVLE